jgi:hypothetical protein
MPAPSPPAKAPRRRFAARPPRAILNAIMAVAVIVLERRIRKALRSGAQSQTGVPPGHN